MTRQRILQLSDMAPHRLTQDERLMVACVVVALLAFLSMSWVCFNPAVDAGALAGR